MLGGTVLCTLQANYNGLQDKFNVEVWPGYGVVTPGSRTTNRDCHIAADNVISHLRSGLYEVTFSILPEEAFKNVESFVSAVQDWLSKHQCHPNRSA